MALWARAGPRARGLAVCVFGCLLVAVAGERAARDAHRVVKLSKTEQLKADAEAVAFTHQTRSRVLQEETPSPTDGGNNEDNDIESGSTTPSPVEVEDEGSSTPSPVDEGTEEPSTTTTPSPVDETSEPATTPGPADAEGDSPTPAPVDAAPVVPTATTPAPVDDGATTPAPVDDGATTPAPVDDGATTPGPVDDGTTTPAPVDDGATTPAPVDDGATTPGPVDDGTTTPAPVDDGTTTPAPVDDGATTPAPVDDGQTPVPVGTDDESEEDGTSPTPSPAQGESPVESPTVPTTDSPVTSPPFAPSTCSNGIPGVQNGKVCCKEECGQCGGTGCGAIPGTNGGSDCCPSTILAEQEGEFCGEAPCIIAGITPAPTMVPGTPAPYAPSTCANGIPGVDDGETVCCKQECGQCGGEGCGAILGTNGASDCCPDQIKEEQAGTICGDAPCIMAGFTPAPANPAFSGTAAPVSPSTCSNGLPGYQDGDACCSELCGQCGGAGCGTIPGTGGADFCCSSNVRESGVICGEPPCIIEGYTPAPAVVGGGTTAPVGSSMCSNGISGYQDGAVCCAANCGQCGGVGCGAVPGTGGASACCSSIIEVEGDFCSNTNEAPCIIEGYTPAPVVPDYGSSAPVVPSICSNGMPGYQDLDVCCLEACGQCGGAGCGTIPGTGGNEFCCSSTIRATGEVCGAGVNPPCIIGDWTPSPVNPAFEGTASPVVPSTCINGLAGVQNGAACCSENCGQCGGAGCGTIPGTGGSEYCCASTVLQANQICGVNEREAPCVIENFTPAPAGIPGTSAPYVASTCSNGFAGVQDEAACCAENCGQCGGAGCGMLPGTGGSNFCCSSSIIANGTACSAAGAAPCFIDDWVPTPSPTMFTTAAPVLDSTCSNGLPGYQDGPVCCKEACGMCGGEGCGRVNGTAGASDCCPSTILANNQTCGGQIVAPCIIAATPAPTQAPMVTPIPTPVPFISGNARDFVSAADVRAGPGLSLPIMTAFVVLVMGAFAFDVRPGRGLTA